MSNIQMLGDVLQAPPSFNGHEEPWAGQSLGNPGIQISEFFAELPLYQLGVDAYRLLQRRLESTSAGNRLAALKELRFSPEAKAERIARSVRALGQAPALNLSAPEWRSAAEAVDFEEEY